jgi:hypothetical protein
VTAVAVGGWSGIGELVKRLVLRLPCALWACLSKARSRLGLQVPPLSAYEVYQERMEWLRRRSHEDEESPGLGESVGALREGREG